MAKCDLGSRFAPNPPNKHLDELFIRQGFGWQIRGILALIFLNDRFKILICHFRIFFWPLYGFYVRFIVWVLILTVYGQLREDTSRSMEPL